LSPKEEKEIKRRETRLEEHVEGKSFKTPSKTYKLPGVANR
jgi:hypothetical protein